MDGRLWHFSKFSPYDQQYPVGTGFLQHQIFPIRSSMLANSPTSPIEHPKFKDYLNAVIALMRAVPSRYAVKPGLQHARLEQCSNLEFNEKSN